AAQARVQVARMSRAIGSDEILGAHLLREQARDLFDDAIANGMAERVVVVLEAVDVDHADADPARALFRRQIGLEALAERIEAIEPRLRVALRLVAELGDDVFEVARDRARAMVLLAELGVQRLDLFSKPL